MENKKLRVGVIGCGKIAQTRHIPEYLANDRVELVGFYDLNQDRTKQLADKYHVKAYESMDALLDDDSIDAVSICTANFAHAENTIQALKKNKHVLCEKPMAVTLEDCLNMVEASKKANRFLMIGQNQRLLKAHLQARKLIQEGLIGDVLSFQTSFGHGGPETWSIDPGKNTWFFDRKKASMGALADLGIHKTDLIQFLLDDEVIETTAKIVTLDKKDANGNLIQVDDNAICIYRMKKGALGTMRASWTYYGQEDNSTVLYGTKGIMKIYTDPKYSIEVILKNQEKIYYQLDQIQTNDHQTSSGIIDEFVDCVLDHKQPLIDVDSVLHAMKAVFASIESSETNQTVKVK